MKWHYMYDHDRYHDKGGFPYRAAAPLAARLWHRFTMARVILQVGQ